LTGGAGSGWDGAIGAGGAGESQPIAIKGANKNISRHAARFISLSLKIREKPPAEPDPARRIRHGRWSPGCRPVSKAVGINTDRR
jgi:hypothetical protein